VTKPTPRAAARFARRYGRRFRAELATVTAPDIGNFCNMTAACGSLV
jgi:hypothetical protein